MTKFYISSLRNSLNDYETVTKNCTEIKIQKITSVQYLAAYYELVKDAKEGDLSINGKSINLKELRQLAFESQILHSCYLLQKIKVVPDINIEIVEGPLKGV